MVPAEPALLVRIRVDKIDKSIESLHPASLAKKMQYSIDLSV